MILLKRNRRLRSSEALRNLVHENILTPNDFIVPLFVTEGKNIKQEIPSMPGYYRLSLDLLVHEIKEIDTLQLKAILLFTKIEDKLKDNKGTEALNPNGLMQRAIKTIKEIAPHIVVMTDVALDPYSSYGHDGIVTGHEIINDDTVNVLAQMALSHAQAGADVVAPSDMMDGRILAIRKILEENNFKNTAILSYSAKYASSFYGPFRDALDSAPGFGDKKTYQMNPANAKEAILETIQDIDEGADIVMVKPGMPYLDIIQNLAQQINTPIAVYQVSGEYAMLKAAIEKKWLNQEVIYESLIAFKRAGATLITSYFAKDIVKTL